MTSSLKATLRIILPNTIQMGVFTVMLQLCIIQGLYSHEKPGKVMEFFKSNLQVLQKIWKCIEILKHALN